jgi:hypothetical protein
MKGFTKVFSLVGLKKGGWWLVIWVAAPNFLSLPKPNFSVFFVNNFLFALKLFRPNLDDTNHLR